MQRAIIGQRKAFHDDALAARQLGLSDDVGESQRASHTNGAVYAENFEEVGRRRGRISAALTALYLLLERVYSGHCEKKILAGTHMNQVIQSALGSKKVQGRHADTMAAPFVSPTGIRLPPPERTLPASPENIAILNPTTHNNITTNSCHSPPQD